MTRLQKYLDACMHTSANTHSLELTIILSCTPNILLVISRTSVLIIYSFCAEFILGYILLANVREISKSMFGAQENIIVSSSLCLWARMRIQTGGYVCSRVIGLQM